MRTFSAPQLSAVWAIIIVCLLFYIATIINSDIRVRLGLIPLVWLDRPWTIVTNLFIHGGFWHLFGNMITLYFFGTFLSRWIGEKKFLLVYFGGGILGNLFYIWLGEPYSIAIGASGAVFALAGALTLMAPNIRIFVYFVIPMRLWMAVLLFFVLWSFLPGVAWQAHLGGLVGGLIAGYIFRQQGLYYRG